MPAETAVPTESSGDPNANPVGPLLYPVFGIGVPGTTAMAWRERAPTGAAPVPAGA